MKVVARDRWGHEDLRYEPIGIGVKHDWIYRGQVVPTNNRVTVECTITGIDDAQKLLMADGYLAVDGLPLGQPVRLSVHSNAYGKVLFFITLTGGAILVLLVGRRLWHRFRGEPDRADLDRPSRRPDPVDTALAHAPDDP